MSFMGQITIQHVTFVHIIFPRGLMPLCKESALLTFHIYRMHICYTFSGLVFNIFTISTTFVWRIYYCCLLENNKRKEGKAVLCHAIQAELHETLSHFAW